MLWLSPTVEAQFAPFYKLGSNNDSKLQQQIDADGTQRRSLIMQTLQDDMERHVYSTSYGKAASDEDPHEKSYFSRTLIGISYGGTRSRQDGRNFAKYVADHKAPHYNSHYSKGYGDDDDDNVGKKGMVPTQTEVYYPYPSEKPSTKAPTSKPTQMVSYHPYPSKKPSTKAPTNKPTPMVSYHPYPSKKPSTKAPTNKPTPMESYHPYPSKKPSTKAPTNKPTPTVSYHPYPSKKPSTKAPTNKPTLTQGYYPYQSQKPQTNAPTNKPTLTQGYYPYQSQKPQTNAPTNKPTLTQGYYPYQSQKPQTNAPTNKPTLTQGYYPYQSQKPQTNAPTNKPTLTQGYYPYQSQKPQTNAPTNKPTPKEPYYPYPSEKPQRKAPHYNDYYYDGYGDDDDDGGKKGKGKGKGGKSCSNSKSSKGSKGSKSCKYDTVDYGYPTEKPSTQPNSMYPTETHPVPMYPTKAPVHTPPTTPKDFIRFVMIREEAGTPVPGYFGIGDSLALNGQIFFWEGAGEKYISKTPSGSFAALCTGVAPNEELLCTYEIVLRVAKGDDASSAGVGVLVATGPNYYEEDEMVVTGTEFDFAKYKGGTLITVADPVEPYLYATLYLI
ncbi:hypothetical protein IV203_034589 [Nitzschia inconspicua]|uniref:Uncharacterized protein n=1 Tax=Nitzschia inconspicua TaxID=303405 RepID=A0A9K3K8S6_9STRA|nr:hypothetical protein IV203_002648 [Nitzschia inconspicua]KAG7359491.1 hypothetical protein IV203_034589 [Nitzschia inconspicua]